MASLRERKKEDRKSRILDAALRLFEEQGFEITTMEKIAAEADLAVGTLYNYFPSKVELFFLIINAESEQYFTELDAIIAERKGVPEAVFAFCRVYLKSFSLYSKKVWRELFRLSLFGKDSCYEKISNIDSQFCDKLSVLFTLMQEEGKLSKECDIEAMMSAIYSILAYNVMRYIAEEAMTQENLEMQLERQIGIMLQERNT